MALNEALIAEFKQELVGTRKLLAVITDEVLDYQPHPKSMVLRKLALHVADICNWYELTINEDELDFAKGNYKTPAIEKASDLVDYLDKSAIASLKVLEAASDEKLNENWTMRHGEQIYFTMPKKDVIRTWCMNHLYHHRAQLGVYLRLNNIAIPGLYGPSADGI